MRGAELRCSEWPDVGHKKIKTKSDIMPNPSGHRPQRPCAQGRTCAEQELAQGAAPGQTKDWTVRRATTNGRTAKAGQHRLRRRQPRARRRRHTKQERRDQTHALQFHAPRRGTSQGSSRVEEERDEASRGSHNKGTVRGKCCKQHRRCMIRPTTRLQEVIPEECNRQRSSCAQNTRAFKHQVFDVVPPVFSVCVSTRSRPKIRTRGENT